MPRISVVVATHDRADRLERLLDGLEQQTLASSQFEVLVVDDGSGPETVELLERRGATGRLALRVLRRETPAGPATARNEAWPQARSPYIAFTDDDCVPTPRWLEDGLAAMEANPGSFAQGITLPDPAEQDRIGPHTRSLDVRSLGPYFETANVFYPRDLLETLGGFDGATFTGPGGEDADLAWRAIESGARPVLARSAVVHHAVHEMSALDALRFTFRWKETVAIFGRHPGLRRQALVRRFFWKHAHYHLVRTLVALALPRPLRWLALWCAWRYLVLLRQRCMSPGGGGPRYAPYYLLVDVLEVATVARGAVEYRTLVL